MPKHLRCDAHGRTVWDAQVICARDAGGCGRVWKLAGEELHVPPIELGKHCLCGKPLTGEGATARAICRRCYEERKAQPS